MLNKNIKFSFVKKYLSGEAHFGFWNIVQKCMGAMNGFFILTTLTVYQYGVFQLLLALYGMFSDMGSLGVGVVNNDISRDIASGDEARAKRLFKEYFITRLILGVILFSIFFFGSSIFFGHYYVGFIKEIRIIAFLFLTDFAFTTINSLLTIRLEFAIVAARSSIYKITQLVILSFSFYIGSGVSIRVVLISMICASIASSLFLLHPFLRAYGKWTHVKEFSGIFVLAKVFRTYGKWDILRYVVSRLGARVQPWLIKIFISTEAVAIYSVSNSILGVFKDAIPAKTLQSLIPLRLDDKTAQRMFTYGVKYATLLSFVLMMGGYLVVPPVIYVFFPKYIESLPYLFVMLLSLPLWGAGLVTGIYLIALRQQKFMFIHNITRSTVSAIVYAITLPLIGVWGAVFERIFTPIYLTIIYYFYMERYSPGIRFDMKTLVTFNNEDRGFLKNIWRELYKMTINKIQRIFGVGYIK